MPAGLPRAGALGYGAPMSTLGSCRPRRPGRSGAGLAAALAWVALAILAACQRPPPPRRPTPVEERVAAWRADPALPGGTADQLVARGGAAQAAGTPASIA